MGASTWNDDFYSHREEVRKKENKSAFEYNDKVRTLRREEQKVHEKLDPKGVKVRESRDSKEHPESLAVGVMFDVTGSMAQVPVACQKQLPRLMGLLSKTGFVKDPQVLFGAVGDSRCDRASLQIGQFESGIEMDDDLGRMFLEKGGGGSMEESYQNALYFFARHTAADCFEKRGKKGYLFLIGDEKPYMQVSRNEVETLCNDGLQDNIPIETIIKEVQERYHTFFIIPQHTSNGTNPIIERVWSGLLGSDKVIKLDDAEMISEVIALAVAITEGATTLASAKEALEGQGCSGATIGAVTTALRHIAVAQDRLGTSTDATIRL